MIGGESPVIIFNFSTGLEVAGFGVPVPVPIYLDEATTGVMSDNASDNVKIEMQTIGGLTFQRKVIQSIDISFRVLKDNEIATTLLSMAGKVYELIDSKDPTDMPYYITIYYDSSFMLKGYLSSFRKTTIENTNMYQVEMSFCSVASKSLASTVIDKVDDIINI
ncbi:hypothetical protein [Phascolarctobacterium faecium]|uniref:hypothetical protein n=1 Tax=Phascolarctobacterium faecium TaxID=33025 RepID=UPI00242D08BF|nr:hypothetical protein [Phascolarctobacterium faecium]